MASSSQGNTAAASSSRRSRPILSALFRNRRSSYAEYELLYADPPYLNIPPPQSSSSSSLPTPLSISITSPPPSSSSPSPFVHHRPKPLKPRVALDERSPAAALARGQAAQRSSTRGSRRANLSALLLRHRQSHNHNNNRYQSQHNHQHDHSSHHHHHHGHHHSHRPRHLDVVGNDTVSSQGVPVFRGRVPRYPEPNTRRRASSAAAEVRFARANLTVGGGEAGSFSGLDQMRERSASVSVSSPTSLSLSTSNIRGGGCGGGHVPLRLDQLEATEDALLRRAAARGASNTPLVSRLRALRGERAEVQRNWVSELEHIAAQVDALPVRECQCVIDLQDIKAGELVVRLPCLHVFHADCILPWFAKQEHPKCPIDRCPIPKDQVANLPVWRWGDE